MSAIIERKIECVGVTDTVLDAGGDSGGIQGMELTLETDWKVCLFEASDHQSTATAARVATHATAWLKLWNIMTLRIHNCVFII